MISKPDDDKLYGMDIEDSLISILSRELTKSIDAQILSQIFGSKKRKIEKILEKIKNINE